MRQVYKMLVIKAEGKEPLGRPSRDGKIICTGFRRINGVAQFVEALRYKAEGRGFVFRGEGGHWDFSLT